MKIGIMTYHFCSNYGAVLQAYALKRFLEARGHHVEMVDYRPPNDSGALGHNLRLLLQEGYIRLMNRYSSFRLNGKFADFRRTNLSLSSMHYNSLEELKRACLPGIRCLHLWKRPNLESARTAVSRAIFSDIRAGRQEKILLRG